MIDINKKNIITSKKIFDIKNKYKLNIYCGDSLSLDYKKVLGVDQFDIIVANPPYNSPGLKASGNTIWQFFVTKSLELLKPGGYMDLIHPSGWRSPATEKSKTYGLFKLLTKYNTMMYLEIHDVKDGMQAFNCGTRFDFYVIKKKPNNNHKLTRVLDQDKKKHKLDLTRYKWLPNCDYELVSKILASDQDKKCHVIYDRCSYSNERNWISEKKTKIYKYPVVHTTPIDGPRFLWSSRKDLGLFGTPKVIFGDSGINNPILDLSGRYGLSGHAIAIKISNKLEGEKLQKYLISPTFSKILRACSFSNYQINWRIFLDFKHDFYET